MNHPNRDTASLDSNGTFDEFLGKVEEIAKDESDLSGVRVTAHSSSVATKDWASINVNGDSK